MFKVELFKFDNQVKSKSGPNEYHWWVLVYLRFIEILPKYLPGLSK